MIMADFCYIDFSSQLLDHFKWLVCEEVEKNKRGGVFIVVSKQELLRKMSCLSVYIFCRIILFSKEEKTP